MSVSLPDFVRFTHVELMPGVPLYVYAVRGERSSAVVDTGIKAMRGSVLTLCGEVSSSATPLSWVLVTHAHADHIGNNHAVKERFGVRVACGGAVAWLEDFDAHYRAFCLPDVLGDPSGQRAEILGLMDTPTPVDLVLTAGSRVRLGGLDLETIALPGHKLEEIGFLEAQSGTLFLGDLLLALKAPFFHGFDTATGFRASLDRLAGLLQTGQVRTVLAAHHPPLDAAGALGQVAATRAFLDDVETATLEAATGVGFETLWRAVSAHLGKDADFRGYAMLRAHIAELEVAGRVQRDGERIVRA